MTEAFDPFSGGRYLTLINIFDPAESFAASKLICNEGKGLSDDEVSALICGECWRSRLVGQVLAVARRHSGFVGPLVDSWRALRGISIVPAGASMVALLERPKSAPPEFVGIDQGAFDGDVGWTIKKVRHHLTGEADPGDLSPNRRQSFEKHLTLFRDIRDSMEQTP